MIYFHISGIKKKKIVLLTHNNPDGDALGSSLALFLYLKTLNHDVDLISPTEFSHDFDWLPEITEIIVFSDTKKYLIEKKIMNSDYIFFVDFNNLSRIKHLEKICLSSKAKKILIDHHPLPLSFDFMLNDSNASSTSILVFRLISNMNNLDKIDAKIATCLYVGLITDTGYFRYPSVNAEAHFIAGKLMEKGIDIGFIHEHLQEKYHENRLKLLSIALEKLKIMKKYRTVYTNIEESDIRLCSYKKGYVENIVNYGLGIENMVLSVFFFEEKRQYPIRISLRSKGDFDVNLFSRKYFNGGGHKNAAGGLLKKNMSESIQYFVNIIRKHHKDIIVSI
ncbi:DHH family phosphoesterase [Blattabacterium cuenoti]|uniref:DHH family phosphoesterase n=1 Tax=Blattabacterium cuenoti TaxID=1653831 RepID=UPI00163CB8EB|nr:bifunctional oligoribonuclease/PAP phosphatase NrnA [Blattabacterium cuenoti]